MNLKHSDLIIEQENPFQNCKLGRQKYAEALTGIVSNYPSGFVLAINNKWGAGKTTFIKMWEQQLKNSSFKTIYFNAWENDFENNPLTALMGELKTLTEIETEPKFTKALKYAATLSKQIGPILLQAAADKYINTEFIKDALVNTSRGVADIFEDEVNEYVAKKHNIKKFRQSLYEFIVKANDGKPLIFIVDELDRCRPNYAVSILEQIKHFFSVPNIVFVLSIDKTQLGNAIRGVYGSDKIDSDEYLRRFIDLEYSIPEPDTNCYYKYLYEYFNFSSFFESTSRNQHDELKTDADEFLSISEVLFEDTSITLRQQEKIFAHARLALRSYGDLTYVVPNVFLLLIYIKVIDEPLYKSIKSKSLTLEQLQDKFYLIFKNKISNELERSLMRLEVYFIIFYNKYLNPNYSWGNLYDQERKLLIKSVVNPANQGDFLMLFQHIESKRSVMNVNSNKFFEKIELTANLRS